MGKKQTITKRNPNDATMRNIRAQKRALRELEARVFALEKIVETLSNHSVFQHDPLEEL